MVCGFHSRVVLGAVRTSHCLWHILQLLYGRTIENLEVEKLDLLGKQFHQENSSNNVCKSRKKSWSVNRWKMFYGNIFYLYFCVIFLRVLTIHHSNYEFCATGNQKKES